MELKFVYIACGVADTCSNNNNNEINESFWMGFGMDEKTKTNE
jgi:hypothetical protein